MLDVEIYWLSDVEKRRKSHKQGLKKKHPFQVYTQLDSSKFQY